MPTKKAAKRGVGRPKGKVVFDPKKHCGAKTSTKTNDGSPCTRGLGFGTPHPGQGRCRYHGGLTPILHGRYSHIKRAQGLERYHELRERFEAEEDPLDLTPDLISLRARAAVLHEEEQEDRQALRDWHESYTGKFRAEMRTLRQLLESRDTKGVAQALNRLREILNEQPPKPVKLWDPFGFTKAVTAMATLAGKIADQRMAQQVPLRAVVNLQDKMALVMMQVMRAEFKEKGDRVAEKIATAWRDINVEY